MSTTKTNITKSEYKWSDVSWLNRRKERFFATSNMSLPINIYELNLRGFIGGENNASPSYDEIAKILIPYLKYMSYTHIEIFSEYNGLTSNGYIRPGQDTSIGASIEFKHFINELHASNIGVILDLGALIEVNNRTQRLYIGDVLSWIKEYHLDGLKFRLQQDNNLNSSNIDTDFIKALNTSIHSDFPDVMTIASTDKSISDITKSISDGGLGFTFTWNTALMHGIYEYIGSEQKNRKYLHKSVTASRKLFLNERNIIPIHHDDLVGTNHSFISKIYGSYEDKFKQMRTALLLIMTLPGKKHLFMGTEYAQFKEWDKDSTLEWFMLDFPAHKHMRDYVAALNRFYLDTPALWTYDFSFCGFEWIVKDKSKENVFSFKRKSTNDEIYVVFNFSSEKATVSIPLSKECAPKCVFSSNPDVTDNYINVYKSSIEHYMDISLPPHTAKIFKQCSNKNKYII